MVRTGILNLIDELRRLAAGGVAVVLGSCSVDGQPEISRVWAPRVVTGRQVLEVQVPTTSNARALANLTENPSVAVTIVVPTTYRSMQVKGRVTAMKPATAADARGVREHLQAFLREVEPLGLPPELASRVLTGEAGASPEMTRITIAIDALFDQTPGPAAGARL